MLQSKSNSNSCCISQDKTRQCSTKRFLPSSWTVCHSAGEYVKLLKLRQIVIVYFISPSPLLCLFSFQLFGSILVLVKLNRSWICSGCFLARPFDTSRVVIGCTLNHRSTCGSLHSRSATIRSWLLSQGTLTRVEDEMPGIKWSDGSVLTEFVVLTFFRRG